MDSQNKKCSISSVVTYIIYGILSVFAILLIEELIRNFILKTENIFTKNYIKNMIYLIISAGIYFLIMFYEYKKRLSCKELLKIALVLYVFITLNLCNFFDLYTIRVVRYAIFAINGVFFAIFGVSIYYNYLKNESNKVKAKANMVVIFSLALTIAFAFATELVWYLIDLMSSAETISFKYVIFDILFSLGGSIILNIFFYLSLNKSKKFINSCLIDVQKY